MIGTGDSSVALESNSRNIIEPNEITNTSEDAEIKQLKYQRKHYKKNLLTNAQKSFAFLEHQSLVDFVETDGEYIVSAGRDHDINVWDAVEGIHIRRLSGHSAPVTGLYLYNSGETPVEKIIVSSSEDGTLRLWSLNKGEELLKTDTKNVITCMGVMNNSLAITGNHKGYMEVHHIMTGDLYSTILAHMDPIDAIAVEGNYACSATYEAPSCLKVWEIQFEKTTCIYRIENYPEIDFCCFAIWSSMVILGDSNQQKLQIINFKTDKKEIIDLDRSGGKMQQVKVWNEWILSCSVNRKLVYLDVHRIHNYEHFGTFSTNIHQVFAIAAMEYDSSFKIILGGSALAILSFDFVLTEEETKFPFYRAMMTDKTNFEWNKKVSHYTLKNTAINEYREIVSSNSDDEDMPLNLYKSILSTLEPDPDKIHCKSAIPEDEDEWTVQPRKTQVLSVLTHGNMAQPMVPRDMQKPLPFVYDKCRVERMLQSHTEPRVAVRQLEELLDKNNQSGELENCMKNNEQHQAVKHDDTFIKDDDTESLLENDFEGLTIEEISEQEEDTQTEHTHTNVKESMNSDNVIKQCELKSEIFETPRDDIMEEIEKNANYIKKFYQKKNQKAKKAKKKESETARHKKCVIM